MDDTDIPITTTKTTARPPPPRAPKERHVRVYTRISLPLRNRLALHCASKGTSERAVIALAPEQFLERGGEDPLLRDRLDRIDGAMGREQDDRALLYRELELLSLAFGNFVLDWHSAQANTAAAKAAGGPTGAARWRQFAKRTAEAFLQGRRFVEELPGLHEDGPVRAGPPNP